MAKKSKFAASGSRPRGNRTLSIIFYTVYTVLTLSLICGILYANTRLTGWLSDYENTHAQNRSREIFQTWFAEPDWNRLYGLAGIADSQYEDSEAFAAAMDELCRDKELTYQETSPGLTGQRRYLLMLDGESIGWFTLENRAPRGGRMPDWQLSQLHLNPDRTKAVTVLTPGDVTVRINGVVLTDAHVISIQTTAAQDYLPLGYTAPRIYTYYLDGLMTTPQVTVEDSQGNSLTVTYLQEQDAFLASAPEETLTRELSGHCLKAAKAYAQYRISRGSLWELDQYFDTTTEIYAQIRNMEALVSDAAFPRLTYEAESITDFCAYGQDLFSVRIVLPVQVRCMDDTNLTFLVNHSFFFQRRGDTWKCISVTEDDISQPKTFLRITFRLGDQVVSSNMYPSDTDTLSLPRISSPQGQSFAGWFRRETGADGAITYIPVFGPEQTGTVLLPDGMLRESMTLYALFETIQ